MLRTAILAASRVAVRPASRQATVRSIPRCGDVVFFTVVPLGIAVNGLADKRKLFELRFYCKFPTSCA